MAKADEGKQAEAEQQTTGGAMKPNQTTPETSPTTVQNSEPEDAYLTGGQRNLQRRVLGLNVDNRGEGGKSQRPVDQSPGLHSTGSFSGVGNEETTAEPDKKAS